MDVMYDPHNPDHRRWARELQTGQVVHCDFAGREARTADGFCEFCGSTAHQPAEQVNADV